MHVLDCVVVEWYTQINDAGTINTCSVSGEKKTRLLCTETALHMWGELKSEWVGGVSERGGGSEE